MKAMLASLGMITLCWLRHIKRQLMYRRITRSRLSMAMPYFSQHQQLPTLADVQAPPLAYPVTQLSTAASGYRPKDGELPSRLILPSFHKHNSSLFATQHATHALKPYPHPQLPRSSLVPRTPTPTCTSSTPSVLHLPYHSSCTFHRPIPTLS